MEDIRKIHPGCGNPVPEKKYDIHSDIFDISY